jgi:hypothetical protein
MVNAATSMQSRLQDLEAQLLRAKDSERGHLARLAALEAEASGMRAAKESAQKVDAQKYEEEKQALETRCRTLEVLLLQEPLSLSA